MDALLKLESEKLARSWIQHDAVHLGDYLVAGVEDPRVNVQSVLTRHFLLAALFEAKFESLMDHELRFAAAMNWLRKRTADLDAADARAVVLHALRLRADNAEGIELPSFLTQLFVKLSAKTGDVVVPNYIEQFLAEETRPNSLDTFRDLWALFWKARSHKASAYWNRPAAPRTITAASPAMDLPG